jgi:hypothetical protein
LIAERPADGPAERLPELAQQIADNSLRRQLLTGLERRHLAELTYQVAEQSLRGQLLPGLERQERAELTCEPADRAADPLTAERPADGPAERLPELAQQIADNSLRRQLRTGLERRRLSELTYQIAEPSLLGCEPTEPVCYHRVTRQIAEQSLWRKLLTRLEWEQSTH